MRDFSSERLIFLSLLFPLAFPRTQQWISARLISACRSATTREIRKQKKKTKQIPRDSPRDGDLCTLLSVNWNVFYCIVSARCVCISSKLGRGRNKEAAFAEVAVFVDRHIYVYILAASRRVLARGEITLGKFTLSRISSALISHWHDIALSDWSIFSAPSWECGVRSLLPFPQEYLDESRLSLPT